MKKYLFIVMSILFLFFVVSCNRNISSDEYLMKKVEKDLQEVYSISYVATPVLKDYISIFHKEVNINEIKIGYKAKVAMIYGVDFNGEEKLIFIPNYGTSKIFSLVVNFPVSFNDVLEMINTDYPDYNVENTKAYLITDNVVEEDVVFGFYLTIQGTNVIYYFYDNKLEKLIID